MAWNDAVLTNAGAQLLQNTLDGQSIQISGASGGCGISPVASLMALTSLKEQKQTFPVTQIKPVEGRKRICISITNTDLQAAYTLQQIGVWVGDTLFAVMQDKDGIIIPAAADSPDFSILFYALLAVGNEAELTITVDTTAVVNVQMLEEALAEVPRLDESGKVPESQLPEMNYEGFISEAPVKMSLEDGDAMAITDSADDNKTKRVLWSEIKELLGGLFVPLTRKINNKALSADISLTASDVGATRLDSSGKLERSEIPDIDCGEWDTEPVAEHDSTPAAHQNLMVDGNNTAAADHSETLEEHMENPTAHQNLMIDGNAGR